jgi:hypothetical protein
MVESIENGILRPRARKQNHLGKFVILTLKHPSTGKIMRWNRYRQPESKTVDDKQRLSAPLELQLVSRCDLVSRKSTGSKERLLFKRGHCAFLIDFLASWPVASRMEECWHLGHRLVASRLSAGGISDRGMLASPPAASPLSAGRISDGGMLASRPVASRVSASGISGSGLWHLG